ncbi:LytR/AlgR family response regulator transcription factor [Algoriphagus resistens]|uniref:LytR/AlgR family response regulator transcription factor n=1 Tax=Algoriphagus resistens TaxID=1750590 RepID=UPI000716B315|nr:LytTR family DNA-binding domain-containing protein [Algoriphagus resistens]
MKKQTVLIVDRDETSRRCIREFTKLKNYRFVFWECCNGLEAVKYINALQPDLVFMEVDTPGKSGFEVIKSVGYQSSVIFTSTSAKNAAKAFEFHAIDYLIKPLGFDRMQLALQRFEQWLGTQTLKNAHINYSACILVEKGRRLTNIPIKLVSYFKADKDYTLIHSLNGESFLSSTGIGQIERKLDPQYFIRIHRSYIVNVNHIQELHRDINRFSVLLPNAIEINVGRNYVPAIKELIF